MTPEQQREETMEQALEAEQPREPISDEPGAEGTPEAETKTVQEQLAEQVNACVIERKTCENLGSKLDDAAKELGIGLDELIDQVFEIIARKEG